MKSKTVLLLLFVWLIVIFAAAHAGAFHNQPGRPPRAIGIAFGLPLIGFAVAFAASPLLRSRSATVSPVLLAALHGWRFVGLAFIMAYYRGILPPGFAWPAGLGDIAVAASAPYVAYRLARDTAFLRSKSFWVWNVFGILDFLAAVGLGIAHQMVPEFFRATVATTLMQELPFALIPCFFVPLLGITHMIMLYQGRSQGADAAEYIDATYSPGT